MTHLYGSRPIEVLLAEDNEHDFELTRIGFEKARLAIKLHHVQNGEECLAFLRKEGAHADAPTPDLLLLDLNMPIMDGREVLAEIVADERLRQLPVVVLSTSREAEDIQSMYDLRCSSYITKPVDFEQFVRIVRTMTDYWFTVVALPTTREWGENGRVDGC